MLLQFLLYLNNFLTSTCNNFLVVDNQACIYLNGKQVHIITRELHLFSFLLVWRNKKGKANK